MDIKEVKAMLRGEGGTKSDEQIFLSSGSTMLNLGCSGNVQGAFVTGSYVFFCGDSMCGKTWLGLSALAEASIDPRFDNYRLIYDPTEQGARMDLARFFGEKMAERIEVLDPPSETVEGFYYNVDDALGDGRPFIFVQDSQDGLSSVVDQELFQKSKKAYREGEESPGSYGSKAKLHSAYLRTLMGPLERSKSILIILNQTRDSFDPFKPKGYSGGHALLFYATYQLWGSVGKKIEKQIRGKKRQLGVDAKVVIKKNRSTGRVRMVEFPILHSAGIDDTASMVDYLVSEKEWTGRNGKIEVKGIGPVFDGRREAIIRRIEEEGLVDDLKDLVQRTWDGVEEACKVKRRSRY